VVSVQEVLCRIKLRPRLPSEPAPTHLCLSGGLCRLAMRFGACELPASTSASGAEESGWSPNRGRVSLQWCALSRLTLGSALNAPSGGAASCCEKAGRGGSPDMHLLRIPWFRSADPTASHTQMRSCSSPSNPVQPRGAWALRAGSSASFLNNGSPCSANQTLLQVFYPLCLVLSHPFASLTSNQPLHKRASATRPTFPPWSVTNSPPLHSLDQLSTPPSRA
jgi:hypothetical protein